ncbi:hypothetical protein BV898_14175 [Hypsibius exemplaris]|uniref:Uncharacterized protein n=1 Tax=Hypsibius exemplaris TaxID=2072580 RepID=A0A1W0W8I9_HYPEX|nr:hypothetical protein BV898_14175 [Hypsibius exemplaris]
MNGKKIVPGGGEALISRINPLAQVVSSLSGLGSRSPNNLLAATAPPNRPASITSDFSAAPDQALVKYLHSTSQLLKNKNVVSSLPDSGLRLHNNFAKAGEEALKRGFTVVDGRYSLPANKAPAGGAIDASSSSLVPDPAEHSLAATIPDGELTLTASRKVLNKTTSNEPDLVNALRSLNLRNASPGTDEIQHSYTVSTPPKAIPLSLNESVLLEQKSHDLRQAMMEERAQSHVAVAGDTTADPALDFRKYQFLQYRGEDDFSGDDDEDDIIDEESGEEERESDDENK